MEALSAEGANTLLETEIAAERLNSIGVWVLLAQSECSMMGRPKKKMKDEG